MLYPPKKRAFSPEPKKTKELSNLVNINSKFTGSGGSIFEKLTQIHHLLHPKNRCQFPNQSSQEFSKPKSIHQSHLENYSANKHFSESIMTEEISQWP